jgi:tetratricopeptide (TPR) repeat protein
LTEAFVSRYNEVIDEIGRVLSIVRDTPLAVAGPYGLGLALIIARAAELGKYVEPSGADVVLHFTSFAIKDVSPPSLITPILRTLKPLRGKAPHRYLELLNSILNMANLDPDTVKYVLEELNETLDNYGYAIKEHTWSLVHAITTYANLLRTYPVYLSDEVKSIISRVLYLLNELDKSKSSLSAIAWAIALAPALMQGVMGWFMENMFSINMANKVNEVAEELGKLREKIQELMSDGEFMSYVESVSIKADEEAVKTAILNVTSFFKHALALYKLNNDEFDEAARLFNEAAKEFREMNAHEDYIANRDLALRAEAIKGSLVGEELVDGFRRLYEEAFNEEHFMPTARYLNIVSNMLGGYLVSLALTGDYETISKLLEEHWQVLNANEQISVLTRLVLNALLGSKDRKDQLGSELKGKLSVAPWELVNAFGPYIRNKFLPALMVIFGAIKPEDGIKLCKAFIDEDCVNTILAVKGNITAVTQLREWLINAFREVLIVRLSSFRELGVDVDTVFNEFRGLVNGLDGKSLVRLITPVNSRASLAFMLYALINGEEKLAKAHALYGAANVGEKLLTKLLLETHKACCDLSNEPFKHTIAKLFLYHV